MSGVQHGLHQRIAAGDNVADDKHVGAARDALQLLGAESFGERNAQRLQLRRHRRIHIRVATGHAMARRLRDRRDTTHECAADAENMQMHVKKAEDAFR